ncbi:hypothetical protein ACTFIZ_007587 [Dictyostelium cf. discoideum]
MSENKNQNQNQNQDQDQNQNNNQQSLFDYNEGRRALFIFPFDMERIDRINLELSNLPLGSEEFIRRIVDLMVQEPDYLDMFTRRNYIGACGKCRTNLENEYVENMAQIESTELKRAQKRSRVGESGVRIMQILYLIRVLGFKDALKYRFWPLCHWRAYSRILQCKSRPPQPFFRDESQIIHSNQELQLATEERCVQPHPTSIRSNTDGSIRISPEPSNDQLLNNQNECTPPRLESMETMSGVPYTNTFAFYPGEDELIQFDLRRFL